MENKNCRNCQGIIGAANEMWQIFCSVVKTGDLLNSGVVERFIEQKEKIHEFVSNIASHEE